MVPPFRAVLVCFSVSFILLSFSIRLFYRSPHGGVVA